jgi:hypothetical protein
MISSDIRHRPFLTYSKAHLKPPSKNLLIYTQSGMDSSGRRHSASIPLLPSSSAKPDSTVISIQRKESRHGQRGRAKTRGRIQYTAGRVPVDDAIEETKTADDNPAMDCLAVPTGDCNVLQQPPARKPSLPMRKRSTSSERGSSRRSSKQGIL